MLIEKWESSPVGLKRFFIIGVVFTIILGSLLHFTYEWSGENLVVAMFSAVNESTWEHLKLIFMPMFFYTLFGYLIIGNAYENYLFAMAIGVIAGMTAIVVLFYTYTGILGANYLVLDISIFIIGVIIGYAVSFCLLRTNNVETQEYYNNETTGASLLLLLFAMFVMFTFKAPNLNLFIDPLAKR